MRTLIAAFALSIALVSTALADGPCCDSCPPGPLHCLNVKTLDGYCLRCVRQSELLKTTCCPGCIQPWCHCPVPCEKPPKCDQGKMSIIAPLFVW